MFSLIVPTKGRPDGVAKLLKSIDVPSGVMVCATQDSDVPSNISVINDLISVQISVERCSIIQAINRAAKQASHTLAVICDDMEFIPESLAQAAADVKPDYVTGFRTGNIPDAVPISFIGMEYFKRMDNLADPRYQHFFWDQETVDVAIERGKYRFIDSYPLLMHYHPSVTGRQDATFSEGRSTKWINDERVYRSRILHR